jgi:hypothetical protein
LQPSNSVSTIGASRQPTQTTKEIIIMKFKALLIMVSACLFLPGWADAVSEKAFEVQTTQDLLNLCTASPGDPLFQQAVSFCHGYLVGAYKYYEAAHSGPNAPKLICLPNPPPSRSDSIAMFIEWAKTHPQFWKEAPVETEFRFLTEKWPCKQ